MEEVVPGTNHKILIAYFSQPLPNNVDAVTSASRVTVNGELYGSVQYVATIINEATGGDMVRIQTLQPYPENYDDLASQANQERQNNIHPELATNIENFDNYDVVFIGYPIWWYQMPMAMYSFFDKYDFDGKTIIPFSTHGGSGWSGTLEDIAGLEPNATMVNGYSISRNNTATSRDGILNWLQEIGMVE
ncbi:flavodoxin [Paraprevotella clara]|nr:flavodoxin [Paraprevotella clara]